MKIDIDDLHSHSFNFLLTSDDRFFGSTETSVLTSLMFRVKIIRLSTLTTDVSGARLSHSINPFLSKVSSIERIPLLSSWEPT